nr:hypothetical protein [Tanacetum cinerariifolium]
MVNATKESFDEDEIAKFQELLLDTEKLLYKGCPDFTKLSAIVKLLNLKGKKDNKELTVCPTCGISRWKVDNKTHKEYENISTKVMWYFPIIPRLQRLFNLESISKDLRWHATRRITDGVLRQPADSQAWRTIDEKFPEIAKDLRNLRLEISADGVDVNSGTRHHSDKGDHEGKNLARTLIDIPIFVGNFSIILGFSITDDVDITSGVVPACHFAKRFCHAKRLWRDSLTGMSASEWMNE